MFETIWYEKYRPSTLSEMVIDKSTRDKIVEYGEKGEIPHLLLIGSAGIGKTSLAKIIAKEVIDCEYITINASDEGGIDMVRTKIKDFATSASLDEKIKIVILGEADGLTTQAQDSLNEIVEVSAGTTRFIFTANDISKFSAPMLSRFTNFYIKFSEVDYLTACVNIIQKENIEVGNNIKELKHLILSSYPDFRTAINRIQQNCYDGKFTKPHEIGGTFANEVWKMIKTDTPENVRKFCIENPTKFSDHCELMISMVKEATTLFEVTLCRSLILTINDFLVKDSLQVNKEINFYCCVINLCSKFTS